MADGVASTTDVMGPPSTGAPAEVMADGVASTTDVMGPPSTAIVGNVSPGIIVQGGVYGITISHREAEFKKGTEDSAKKGYGILMEDGTAVDAVEAAVRVLEDNVFFNAGYGSVLNRNGEVECGAMIMEGHTLNNGAVISGRHFKNPVSLSKKIMYESSYCALSGDGALEFAREKNFPICKPEELIHTPGPITNTSRTDTVAAVALDANGHFACATSTGGIEGKLKGRVSDASLVGCGGYANKWGAATIAGVGESIIKLVLARQVVCDMESGMNVEISAENALEKMETDVNDNGGVIAIDKDGNLGIRFNTPVMVWASIKDNELKSGMRKDEVYVKQL